MVTTLENYKQKDNHGFNGAFAQLTKSNLAGYEKYSLFTHGRVELLKRYDETDKISFSSQDVHDVLRTATGLFEMLSLLLFVVQDRMQPLGLLLQRIHARDNP